MGFRRNQSKIAQSSRFWVVGQLGLLSGVDPQLRYIVVNYHKVSHTQFLARGYVLCWRSRYDGVGSHRAIMAAAPCVDRVDIMGIVSAIFLHGSARA